MITCGTHSQTALTSSRTPKTRTCLTTLIYATRSIVECLHIIRRALYPVDRWPFFIFPAQVYSAVPGSSSCYEFQSRFGHENKILSRRLPCRCEPCRLQQQGAPRDENHCVLTIEAGDWKDTRVVLKSVLTNARTKQKKKDAKERRAAVNVAKAARIAARMAAFQGDLELAPNTEAAVAAADRSGITPMPDAGELSESALLDADLAFAAAYGAEDSRQVAFTRGETQFTYRLSEREAAIDDELSDSD